MVKYDMQKILASKSKEFRKQFKLRKKVYVYLRVSTNKQENAKFLFETKQFCKRMGYRNPIIIEEKISGKKKIKDRKVGWILEQEDCRAIVAPDQTRLGRSTLENQKIWQQCEEKGIILHCIKEDLNLDGLNPNHDQKFHFDIYCAFGERERAFNSVRTKEGLAYARDVLGKRLGKPLDKYKLTLEGKEEEICDMYEDGMTKGAIAEHFEVNPRTLYRFVEAKEEEITTICRNKDYGRNPSQRRRRRGGRGRGGNGNGGGRRRGGRGRNSAA